VIFVEIGAHYGQSSEIARNPKYGFREFWLFEPSSEPLKKLYAIKDPRYKIFPIGLGSKDFETFLFEPGSKGASIFKKKFASNSKILREKILIKKASTILRPILVKHHVFLKINCEGSEIEILSDLLDYGLLNSTHTILIDFDYVRFNPNFSLVNFLARLDRSGVSYYYGNAFGAEYSDQKVKRWLKYEIRSKTSNVSLIDWYSFIFKMHQPLNRRIYLILSSLIPINLRLPIYKVLSIFGIKNFLNYIK